MSNIEKGVTIFLGGLIAIGFASVFFAPKSNAPQTISAAGGALSGSLTAAEGGV